MPQTLPANADGLYEPGSGCTSKRELSVNGAFTSLLNAC